MAADIMQAQIEPVYGADQADQYSDDGSIDIINSSPDTEPAQQRKGTSPERTNREEANEDTEMQEATPVLQLLPFPDLGAQVHEQHKVAPVEGSASHAAAQEDGSARAAAAPAVLDGDALDSPAEDSSGEDEAPLASMHSQEVSEPALGTANLEDARQQQQHSSAQSRLSPTSSIGRQCLCCCSEAMPHLLHQTAL